MSAALRGSEPTGPDRIVIVDDDVATRTMVGDYLTGHGFEAVLCDGTPSLRQSLAMATPALVILDLNMPGEDGLAALRYLRATADVPVIMLTATSSVIDRVVGLELGADDYLAKPCELRELLARVRSVLRRANGRARGPEAPAAPAPTSSLPPNPTVRFGTKRLDLAAQVLLDDEDVEHALTASEFALLKAFSENPRRVLTRERLLDLAQARDAEAFDRAIDVRIARIRRKIEPDPSHPRTILTVRGGGYVFKP